MTTATLTGHRHPAHPGGLLGTIRVPVLGIDSEATTVHVLEGRTGLVLVDAGWDDDPAWDALTSGLTALGGDVEDVEGVVLTHHHPDHAGLAQRVRDRSDCWVAAHVTDAVAIRENRETPSACAHLRMELDNLRRAGAPEAEVEAYRGCGGSYPLGLPMTPVDVELEDGDTVGVGAGDLRCVWLPGHTAGHIGFALDDERVLFSGDHVLPDTTPHVGEFEFPYDVHDLFGSYVDSLGRVARMVGDGYRLLPAHGVELTEAPGFDWSERIGEIRSHQYERLDDCASVLDDGRPRTLWEVAAGMRWARPWDDIDPIGKQLALSEASVHVSHLVRVGLAEATRLPFGLIRFRARRTAL